MERRKKEIIVEYMWNICKIHICMLFFCCVPVDRLFIRNQILYLKKPLELIYRESKNFHLDIRYLGKICCMLFDFWYYYAIFFRGLLKFHINE